jgi:hypothetical protein
LNLGRICSGPNTGMVNSDPTNSPSHFALAIATQLGGLGASFLAGLFVPAWIYPGQELQAISHQVEEVVVGAQELKAAISGLVANATTTTTTGPTPEVLFPPAPEVLSPPVDGLDWAGNKAVEAVLHCPNCDFFRAFQSGLLLGLIIAVGAIIYLLRSVRAGSKCGGRAATAVESSPLAELARAQTSQVRGRRQHGFGR